MAVAHVVGGLSPDDGRLFRSHLLECTSCRARVGELRAIAHDLADVERDEKRVRAAKRTETKERVDRTDDEDVAPPSGRLGGRAALLVAAALTILMALSAWNFLLRGRVQQNEQVADQLREATLVLETGTRWTTVAAGAGVTGQVSTDDDAGSLAVYLTRTGVGLEPGSYTVELFDGDGARPIHELRLEVTDGVLWGLWPDVPDLDTAERVQIVEDARVAQPPPVLEASRPGARSVDDVTPPDAQADDPVGGTGDGIDLGAPDAGGGIDQPAPETNDQLDPFGDAPDGPGTDDAQDGDRAAAPELEPEAPVEVGAPSG